MASERACTQSINKRRGDDIELATKETNMSEKHQVERGNQNTAVEPGNQQQNEEKENLELNSR